MALTLATPSAAAKKETYVYGPAPDWKTYKSLGESAVLAKMPDAPRWTVEWPNAYVKAGWGPRGRTPGYMTCGVLRAREPVTDNRYSINFAVVIDYNAVKLVDIATASNSPPSILCPALVRKGMLPPASTMPPASTFAIGSLGLSLRVMPEGAYVLAAASGSMAAKTGLTPGMLITRVNGISLAGMGAAMAKLLESDAPSLKLELVTGETLTLRGQQ